MFVAVVFLEGKREHRAALRDSLVMHAKLATKDIERCRRVDISIDPLDDASLLIYAVFDDEASYMAYQESKHYADVAILIEPWTASRRVLTYNMISQWPPVAPATPTHPGGHA
jgi:autoinducer 2-degrading protein